MRTLPLAPTQRYLVVLGDEAAPHPEPPAGFRVVRLAMEGASAATVRYAQLPRLKELGVVPDTVAVFVGAWDLLQSGGEDGLPAARAALTEHLGAALEGLAGARIVVGAVQLPPGFDDAPGLARWRGAFDAALRTVAERHGAAFTRNGTLLWEGL